MKKMSLLFSVVIIFVTMGSLAGSRVIRGEQAQVQYFSLKAMYELGQMNRLHSTGSHKSGFKKENGLTYSRYSSSEVVCELEWSQQDYVCTYNLEKAR